MTKPTVSKVLFNAFGSDFSGATQEQRLLLLQTVALCLRTGGAWSNKLHFARQPVNAPSMPETCFVFVELGRNEGLKLLAILNVAIVEGYSVVAASERLR
ncbi:MULTISPECIES: hypothetical protein [unclassified Microcoleus]|uniref:hypothetical protein n=1 Tax=unclassified Microcoleus TaxID=2642155 RepID=UPI002FD070E1